MRQNMVSLKFVVARNRVGGLSGCTFTISLILMHQSYIVPGPTGPGNSGAFNFSAFKALLNLW